MKKDKGIKRTLSKTINSQTKVCMRKKFEIYRNGANFKFNLQGSNGMYKKVTVPFHLHCEEKHLVLNHVI